MLNQKNRAGDSMPKILPILFISIALTFNCTTYIDLKSTFSNLDGKIELHTNISKNIPYTQTIPNGNSYILSTSLKNIEILLTNVDANNIKGCTIFINSNDINYILSQLGLQYFQSNNKEILGYSSLVPWQTELDGNIFNTHIILNKNQIVIGFPLILGSC